jgi:hypothetical protein
MVESVFTLVGLVNTFFFKHVNVHSLYIVRENMLFIKMVDSVILISFQLFVDAVTGLDFAGTVVLAFLR